MLYSKIITSILILFGTPMLNAQNLKDYQWQNRLVFLVDQSLETPAMQSQFLLLSKEVEELEERALLLFQLTPHTITLHNGATHMLTPNHLYAALAIPKNFKGVLLIGKDGGIKLKKGFEVQPNTIFALIDGMPMRRSEMKRKQGN